MSCVCQSIDVNYFDLCLHVTVIVTEKTNILLRYLHQQWERKVSPTFSDSSCRQLTPYLSFQNKKRDNPPDPEEVSGSAKKRPRLENNM